MDKSPWDSQNTTSILCVSQVLSRKKQCCLFTNPCLLPPPHPIQCWKIKGIVPWQFQHCLWGGGGVGTYSASSAQVQFRVCWKAFELYNCTDILMLFFLELISTVFTMFYTQSVFSSLRFITGLYIIPSP